MAVASIKLTASASSYTAVMKQANAQMRQLQQEYSLAAQKAKLMGQSHQEVGARVQMLTEKIKAQEEKISANSKRVAELTAEDKKLWQQHSELQNKLNQTKTAYDKSAEATGKVICIRPSSLLSVDKTPSSMALSAFLASPDAISERKSSASSSISASKAPMPFSE